MAKRTKAKPPEQRRNDRARAEESDVEPFRMDTAAAEVVSEIAAADLGADVGDLVAAVQGHVADPYAGLTQGELRSRIEFLEAMVALCKARLRKEIEAADFADRPFFRMVGRVLHVLTHHREQASASGSDVFLVFLAELPGQLEDTHRQNPPGNRPFDPVAQPGLANIYTRLRRLVKKEYADTTAITAAGSNKGYVLTSDGAMVFDSWPDIPELSLTAPVTSRPLPPRADSKRRHREARSR
jgi:hypothetical protein